jgi:predicted dehydrogenase
MLQGMSASLVSARLMANPLLRAQSAGNPASRTVSANDRIRVGLVGPGSRGQELIRQLLRVPEVEIAAVCDVYQPRFAEVNTLVGKNVPRHTDFPELLARKDMDCIFVATPPVFHAPYAIAAMKMGFPVYGEKTIGFTPEDCTAVVDCVTVTKQIFQVGHQLRYGSWVQEAIRRVQKGQIGEPTHIYAYWHRSDDWRREVPDPKLEHLINWRLYRESSGGLLEELGSHHLDIANWVFGEQPQTAIGSESIVVHHDGRTVGDNVQAIFGYSKGRRMFFSSLTDNALMADQLWIYGTEGSVQITLEDATFYSPAKKSITAASHSEIVQKGVETGASYQANWEMPYRGPGDRLYLKREEDATLSACRAFIDCVRERRQPIADVNVGFRSGMACAVGKQALASGQIVNLPQLAETVQPAR